MKRERERAREGCRRWTRSAARDAAAAAEDDDGGSSNSRDRTDRARTALFYA